MAIKKSISNTTDNRFAKEAWLMSAARVVIKPIYFALYRPRIYGRENFEQIKKDGPVIFIGNHIGEFDAVSIGLFTPRNPHFLAKIELSRNKKSGWLMRRMGLVFVDRDVSGAGIEEALKFLRAGRTVTLFPEGTCNPKYKKANELLPFKFGAAKMALASNAIIVPAAISGQYKFWARPVVRFGKPFQLDKKQSLEKNNERLRDEILKLMKISGVKNPRKIAGKPARNPSKAAPISENND